MSERQNIQKVIHKIRRDYEVSGNEIIREPGPLEGETLFVAYLSLEGLEDESFEDDHDRSVSVVFPDDDDRASFMNLERVAAIWYWKTEQDVVRSRTFETEAEEKSAREEIEQAVEDDDESDDDEDGDLCDLCNDTIPHSEDSRCPNRFQDDVNDDADDDERPFGGAEGEPPSKRVRSPSAKAASILWREREHKPSGPRCEKCGRPHETSAHATVTLFEDPEPEPLHPADAPKRRRRGALGNTGGVDVRIIDGQKVPVIDVKVRPLFDRMPKVLQNVPEEVRRIAFERRAEEWWANDAPALAEQCLGKAFGGTPKFHIEPVGRSNGHLAVIGVEDPIEWNSRQLAAWERFEKAIKKSMLEAEKDWHRLIREEMKDDGGAEPTGDLEETRMRKNGSWFDRDDDGEVEIS